MDTPDGWTPVGRCMHARYGYVLHSPYVLAMESRSAGGCAAPCIHFTSPTTSTDHCSTGSTDGVLDTAMEAREEGEACPAESCRQTGADLQTCRPADLQPDRSRRHTHSGTTVTTPPLVPAGACTDTFHLAGLQLLGSLPLASTRARGSSLSRHRPRSHHQSSIEHLQHESLAARRCDSYRGLLSSAGDIGDIGDIGDVGDVGTTQKRSPGLLAKPIDHQSTTKTSPAATVSPTHHHTQSGCSSNNTIAKAGHHAWVAPWPPRNEI